MPGPTRQQCFDGARDLLTDTEVVGGDKYTDARLEKSYDTAFRDLVRGLELYLVPELERVVYLYLPQYVGRLDLAAEGISTLSDPTRVREAIIADRYAITSVTNTPPVAVGLAVTPLGIVPGSRVFIYGVGGQTGANGSQFVSSVAGDDVILAGASTEGAYTTGGELATIVTSLTEVYPVNILSEEIVATSNREYVWRDGEVLLNPTPQSSGRLIEVTFFERIEPTQAGNLPFNDCLDFLKHQIAAYASRSDGIVDYADYLQNEANKKLGIFLRNYRIRRQRGGTYAT